MIALLDHANPAVLIAVVGLGIVCFVLVLGNLIASRS